MTPALPTPHSPPAATSDAVAIGVFVLDNDGRLLDCNDAAELMLAQDAGGCLEAALGNPEAVASALAGVPSSTRLRLGAALTGRSVTLSVLSDGNSQLLGVATPVSAAACDGEPASECRRWMDEAPAMVAYVDDAGHVMAANRRLRERLGYPAGVLTGLPLVSLAHAGDQPRLAQQIAAWAEEPGASLDSPLSLRILGADGELVDVDMAAAPVHGDDGGRLGLCVLLQDVGDRRGSEREMEAYTHDLEQLYVQLERRSQELEQAYEDLRQARIQTVQAEQLARIEQMKTAFLDVAAHELRTPVTLLLGILSCLKRLPPGPASTNLLDAAERSAERLANILNTALKLLASGQPDFTGRFKQGSLVELIRHATADVQSFAEMRAQELAVALPDSLPDIAMDASMIRDVVTNLLMNAIKFTPNGGCITVSAGPGDDGTCWFSVRDTGLGIRDEDLPFIFEGFFGTLDTSHHSSGSYEFNTRGPGLGLAVVRKFVDHHRGNIDVTTDRDRGSCFTVTLPVDR